MKTDQWKSRRAHGANKKPRKNVLHGIAIALASTAVSFLISACGKLELVDKYFFTACAGDGPEPDTEFDIDLPPLDMESFYQELATFEDHYLSTPLARVTYQQQSYPIFRLQPKHAKQDTTKPKLLIVVGIHGNERAALLALPRILSEFDPLTSQWQVAIIAPANPVGAQYGSRYNGDGCDINRDFNQMKTTEAQAIANVIDNWQPDLIVALHEGPQQGFFLIATHQVDNAFSQQILASLQKQNIDFANKSFLGLSLGQPGLSKEGSFISTMKDLLALGSLGTYGDSLTIGTITTESDWHSKDHEARIQGHVATVLSILATPYPKRNTHQR